MKIDDVEQLVPFGNFIIQKPDNEEAKEKTSFTGYDYMIKFNATYKNRVVFPCKAKVLFQDICSQAGLEAGNIDFTNCDYMILGNPFTNNEDCRTVLSNISQLAGGFAKIGRDNKVYVKTLKNISNLLTVKYVNAMTVKELNLTLVKLLSGGKGNADEKLDGNNYFDDFSKNEQWGELNSLVLGLSSIEGENTALDDKHSIKENGLTEITIQDNYFLTSQDEREKAIVSIWDALKGIKYLPFKTEYYGYPYLDSGDMIYIQDTKDVGYVSYIFNHTFKFNGGFSGTLETPAMTKTQTAYKNTSDLKNKLKQAERKIDKIDGIIEDIIEEQTETSEKLSQHEQTIDSISDLVSSVETKVETVEAKVDNAQSTADTANTNAQNAQNIVNNINENLTTNYYTKTEANTQINQKANEIETTVSENYSTKIETVTAKEEAINSANANTDEKLENYSTTTEMNSVITQKANEIIEKINQIENITNIVEGTKTIVLGNCVEGNLLELHIYGNNTVFDYLYPSDNLYPSDDLFPYGDSRIVVINKDGNVTTYELGATDVLRQNGNVQDEFVLENSQAKVIRRINKDGTIRTTEEIEDLGNLYISLAEGTNTITIENYSTSMKAKFAIANDFTDIFATKVEMNAKFELQNENINIELSKKVDDNKIIASINMSTEKEEDGSELKLKADKIGLEGTITANGNFKIDEEGNMECKKATCEDIEIKNSTIREGSIQLKSTLGSSSFSVVDTDEKRLNSELCASFLKFNSNLDTNVADIGVDLASGNGFMSVTGIAECGNLIQASKKERKKYIKKVNKKAIDLINNSDICQYQLKGEKATGYRHYGLVIGEKYNCPQEVIAENGRGVEIYSMITLAWKAIQELSNQNRQQEKTIKQLLVKIEELEGK